MKKIFVSLLLLMGLFTFACKEESFSPQREASLASRARKNPHHPMKDSLDAIIQKYIAKGIPGVQVAVKTPEGWYSTSGGYANTETATPFKKDMVSFYFSLTKMYTASLVMQLKERGIINLDAPINQYLPAEIVAAIPASDKITVRMLLNHTSGIISVTVLPEFIEWQYTKPLQQPSLLERVAMVYQKPLLFEPGSDFSYSNTNYLLLHYIIERVAGVSFQQLLHEQITHPHKLKQTYYQLSDYQLNRISFPNYYFDGTGTGELTNATEWNKALGNSCVSYGGIAGTPTDAILFMEALVNGHIVNQSSLQEMKTWVQGKTSTQPDYGLGLEYYQYGWGTPQYGHEGDGVGCTTQLMYVPDNQTYLYINITVGRQIAGPYLFKSTDMKNELCRYIARYHKTS